MIGNMLRQDPRRFRNDDASCCETSKTSDNGVDPLNEAIKLYLTDVNPGKLATRPPPHRRHVTFTTNLEHVGDIIDKN